MPAELLPDCELASRLFRELATRTGGSQGITRMSYGEGEQVAHDLLRQEGEQLGLEVETDAACNMYLTLRGKTAEGRIIIGSHLDSVPCGGNFDGAAGVLCGISVLSGIVSAGLQPPRHLTVMAIRAEESTWFPASYIGSRAAFGLLTSEELDTVRRIPDRTKLDEAIESSGGNVERLRAGEAYLDPAQIGLFIEPHIEQGPRLIMEGCPIGVVSGIRGSFRHRSATCLGSYAHSGTTPRPARSDAVQATSALVMSMEQVWDEAEKEGEDLSITFGKIATDPSTHAFSKIAGRVEFSLDIRSRSTRTLDRVAAKFYDLTGAIADRYSVSFDLGPKTGSDPANMDSVVISALQSACNAECVPRVTVPCGAGHDAAVFAQVGVPTGMILIRNEHGSHNPDEAMEMEDFAKAARIMTRICMDPPA